MAEPNNSTQTVTTQTRMPAEIVPYFQKMLEQSQSLVGRPYQAYGAPRLAGLTNPEVAAQQGIASLGMSGGPNQFGAANSALNNAMTGLGGMAGMYSNPSGIAGLDANNPYGNYANTAGVGAMGESALGPAWTPTNQPSMVNADMSKYMNPYTENVVKQQQLDAIRQSDRQMANLASEATSAGAQGGYRHGLLENDLRKQTRQNLGQISSKGLQDSFANAQQMFEGDRQAGFTGRGQQMQAYSGLGQMAGQMAGLGGQEQSMQYERLAQMEAAGQRQRGLQQAGMDMGYQDFQRQNQYPQEQINWMSNILNALPQQQNMTQSTFQQQPGLFQSVLGTGVAGLGMYNAMNKGNG